jgi:amino acid transporter
VKYKFKIKKKKRSKNKKFKLPFKIEFTKLILGILIFFSIRWVEMSFDLLRQGFDSNPEVTTTIVSVMIGGLVSIYMAKSFGEKNSRNKYNYHKKYDLDNSNDDYEDMN